MEILVGKWAGFCSGVQRAIKGAKETLKENDKIYCLGEIIHNPAVVNTLKQDGMEVVDDISRVPDRSKFIVRSHGLQNDIIKKAHEKKLQIYDFTCPKVKNIHRLVKELTEDGYFILIIGNPEHPEVKAIVSLTEGNARVVETPEDLKTVPSFEQSAVVVQTTFNPKAYLKIVKEIILLSKKTVVYNTLCEETIKRQKEAIRLAEKVDYIIVVGGKNSSNTKTIYNIVKSRVPAAHIEDTHELDINQFRNIQKVGIISGASTPKDVVKEVYSSLLVFLN